MNVEILQIIAMGSGAIMFPLGGTGFKYLRRYVFPLILAGVALFGGLQPLNAALYAVLTCGALHLPYGSKTPYLVKFLVGCAFVAPTLLFGFTIWQIITPVAFIGLFRLSNWKPLANEFTWKIVEAITGLLIGISLAVFLK